MKLYIRLEAPYEWVRVDGKKVEGFGQVASPADYPMDNDYEVVGVVPGEWVTAHRLSLPAKSRKQFQAAVAYALEESISEEVDDLHFVCPNWRVGEVNTVLVVSKDKMREWQNLANEQRLPVATLIPDNALVPLHDGAECTLSLQDEKLLVNTKDGYGVTLDQEFLDVWLMDVPLSSTIAINEKELTEKLIASHPDRDFRHWPIGNKLAHWLEYPQAGLYDLWTETYRPTVNRLGWKAFSLPLMILAIALIAKMGFDSYRYLSLRVEIASIDSQMQEVVKTTFPEIDYVEKDKEQLTMQDALQRRSGPLMKPGVHSMLAEAANVLRAERVTLNNLVYRDEAMILTCVLNDFSLVDKLNKRLNASPSIAAQLQSSSADDGKVVASFELRHS